MERWLKQGSSPEYTWNLDGGFFSNCPPSIDHITNTNSGQKASNNKGSNNNNGEYNDVETKIIQKNNDVVAKSEPIEIDVMLPQPKLTRSRAIRRKGHSNSQ